MRVLIERRSIELSPSGTTRSIAQHVGRLIDALVAMRRDGDSVSFVLPTLSCAISNSKGRSYLAGALPLVFSLSSRQLRLITALGTGVLVGTSLIVIIPEGIETLYSASGSSHSHAERSISAIGRRGLPAQTWGGNEVWRRHAIPAAADIGVATDPDIGFVTGPGDGFEIAEEGVKDNAPINEGGVTGEKPSTPHDEDQDGVDQHDEEDGATRDPHAWVGVSLIAGFILMYLIDTLPRHASTRSQPQRFSISLNSFSFNRRTSEIPETPTQDNFQTGAHSHSSDSRPSSTTVGLVIHGAADGIALGASSVSTSRLSFIIFIALMIHKAPAAFGLTSVLLKQGLSKRMAKAHLIVFSLAAPVGALLTWAAAHLLGYSSSTLGSSVSTEFATGVLLLFSAGTFLYVAMHTMQENGSHDHGEAQGNGYLGVPSMEEGMYGQSAPPPKQEQAGLLDTLVTVGGMLLPLLTQFGHVH